jgi:glycosyltransferase involved in cell wall biosynthesis
MAPTGLNPFVDAANTVRMSKVLRRLGLGVLLTNTVKPVVFGSVAAAIAGVPRRYALISGLGYAFTDDGRKLNLKKLAVGFITALLYSIACRLNSKVIFQNQDDLDLFRRRAICPSAKAVLVAGSGVDLLRFPFVARSTSATSFVMVARLLAEKGVREFLEAARLVKARYPEARFTLVGGGAGNPSAVPASEVQPYVDAGIVECPGDVPDVSAWLRNATVFVLPSYREGIPRSTLEAMATGLCVVTTDVPGCRETVVEGVNGLLVPPRCPQALAKALTRLMEDPVGVERMGCASREMAEQKFDVVHVNEMMCRILRI